MRARKVITRSGIRVRGYFYSQKNRNLIPWESQLERQFLLTLEFDGEIARFQDHQRREEITGCAAPFSTYPDFEAWHHDGRYCIIEVKSDSAAADPEVSRRLTATAHHFALQGIEYRTALESEIRREPRASNLVSLIYFRNIAAREAFIRDGHHERLVENARRIQTIGTAKRALGSSVLAMIAIANDLLSIDVERTLVDTAPASVVLHGAETP